MGQAARHIAQDQAPGHRPGDQRLPPQHHRLQPDPHTQTDQCLTPISAPTKETSPNPAENDPLSAIRMTPTHPRTGSQRVVALIQQTAKGDDWRCGSGIKWLSRCSQGSAARSRRSGVRFQPASSTKLSRLRIHLSHVGKVAIEQAHPPTRPAIRYTAPQRSAAHRGNPAVQSLHFWRRAAPRHHHS